MTENERFKMVRKQLSLTAEEFAKPLGVGRSAISNIESGARGITGQIKVALARAYNVNEEWMATGEGEMFLRRTDDDELAELFAEILGAGEDDSIKKLAVAFAKLSRDQRKEAADLAVSLAEKIKN